VSDPPLPGAFGHVREKRSGRTRGSDDFNHRVGASLLARARRGSSSPSSDLSRDLDGVMILTLSLYFYFVFFESFTRDSIGVVVRNSIHSPQITIAVVSLGLTSSLSTYSCHRPT
jgi:hypothetical protein